MVAANINIAAFTKKAAFKAIVLSSILSFNALLIPFWSLLICENPPGCRAASDRPGSRAGGIGPPARRRGPRVGRAPRAGGSGRRPDPPEEAAGRVEAINVFASPLLSSLHQSILDGAASYHFPAIYQWREHAEEGGLVSYGPSLTEVWRQTATVVGKVLKGAKPGDLPIEQPTKFELAVNMKTAKAIGVTIPRPVLLRADQVIDR